MCKFKVGELETGKKSCLQFIVNYLTGCVVCGDGDGDGAGCFFFANASSALVTMSNIMRKTAISFFKCVSPPLYLILGSILNCDSLSIVNLLIILVYI
jgi:hypothetical protein